MATKRAHHTTGEPLCYSVPAAAAALGLCENTVWGLIKAGVITPTRIGRRTLIQKAELDRMLADLTGTRVAS